MELLEFTNRLKDLCQVSAVSDIGDALYKAVLLNETAVFEGFEALVGEDPTKDWLQALYQYYMADREEKKQDYTPVSLCKLAAELLGEVATIYDCCGGSGALTCAALRKNEGLPDVVIEELDGQVIPFLLFNLCLRNTPGYVINGDVFNITTPKPVYELIPGERYAKVHRKMCQPNEYTALYGSGSISNPPFNIRWKAPTPLEAEVDGRFPVIPPESNANYAFVMHCLARASHKAVLILPNGVQSERTEAECRKYLVDNDLLEAVIVMPDRMFESTSISTCILVLDNYKSEKTSNRIAFIDSRKNCEQEEREQKGQYGGASHTGRTYKKTLNVLSDHNIEVIMQALEKGEDVPGFCAFVNNDKVAENEYILTPSRYVPFKEEPTKHRPLQEIADNLNYITRMRNSVKLVINETLAKSLGLDVQLFRDAQRVSNNLVRMQKDIGVDLLADDCIQFTKNKNEFILKCNDKEALPDLLVSFLNVWKNTISLLTTMQNNYIEELKDAEIPDLMSGVIDVSNVQVTDAEEGTTND